jgi:hypothetical protein
MPISSSVVSAVRVELNEILWLRALFLQEANCQIRYNACHERGWTDSYLLRVDELNVGYASVQGQERADRDTLFEFYVVPPYRSFARSLFDAAIAASGVALVECQSNDILLPSLMFQTATEIRSPVLLFSDGGVTNLSRSSVIVRLRRPDDVLFSGDDGGDFVADHGGDIVATGGFLSHYNPPFADLYMEVRSDCRRRGYGGYVIQEVKKACYLAGRVPAARCNRDNAASRAALIKGGMKICGAMLLGTLPQSNAPPG